MSEYYTIRPLRWRQHVHSTDDKEFEASTIFGSITVRRDYRGWFYSYCFDEVYDEAIVYCDSLEDALERANSFYLDRLLPALDPQNPNVIWVCGKCKEENRWRWEEHDLDEVPDIMVCDHCGTKNDKPTVIQFGATNAATRK